MPHRKLRYNRKASSDYVPFSDLWSRHLSPLANIKLLLLELLFAKDLTRILIDTASTTSKSMHMLELENQSSPAPSSSNNNGLVADLSKFLPATMITKLFEQQLTEVLFYKYWQQYHFFTLSEASEANYVNSKDEDDITNVQFCANRERLSFVGDYLQKLNLVWLSIEGSGFVVGYLITSSMAAGVGILALIEIIKRLRF